MDLKFPNKTFLFIIILLALIGVLTYVFMVYNTPEGKVFVGYVDVGLQFGVAKSVLWGFHSPWDVGLYVFQNPHLGSPYTLIALGTIPTLLNMDMLFFMVIVRFILAVILLILIYNVFRKFDPLNYELSFIVFVFATGIGVIIYGILMLSGHVQDAHFFSYALTYEFEEGDGGALSLSHLTRVYWIVPEIFGMLMLLYLADRKFVKAGLFLGLAFLCHPMFGVGFGLAYMMFVLCHGMDSNRWDTMKGLLIAGIFTLPWLLASMSAPEHFVQYREWYSSTPFWTIVVSNLPLLVIAAYGIYKTIKQSPIALITALVIVGTLSTMTHLYDISYRFELIDGENGITTTWLREHNLFEASKSLYGNIYVLDIVVTFLLLVVLATLMHKNYDKIHRSKPIVLWLFVLIILCMISPQIFGNMIWTGRLKFFLIIPLAMIAGNVLSNIRFERRIIIIVTLCVLSCATMMGFVFHMMQVVDGNKGVYIDKSDYDAEMFLRTQPQGRVFADYEISHTLPYLSNHETVLFNNVAGERLSDYDIIFGENDLEKKQAVIDKYDLKYVYVKPNQDFNNSFLFSLIYKDSVRIYRIKGD